MAPRAVIFDLWNTLIPFDPEGGQRMMESIAEALGVPFETFRRAWIAGYDQRLVSDLRRHYEAVCHALGVNDAEAVEEGLKLRIEAHRRMFVPRRDAVPTLQELRTRGYATALLTNCTSEVPGLVAASPLAGLFDVEIYSCEVGLRKPNSAIFELVAARLGVTPELCLYIGDGGDEELDGARTAGMDPVLLRPGDTHPPKGWQGLEIERLGEVLALVP